MKRFLWLPMLFLALAGFASERVCGTMEHLHNALIQDPELQQRMDAIEAQTHDFVRNYRTTGNQALSTITIPVVVHVVYNTAAQNVTDAQIQAQLDVLNKDFSATNSDVGTVPSAFAGLVANTGIQFCLARRDPQGNPTTGIIRKSTSVTAFSTNNGVKYSAQGGSDAWPRDSYLNIWICNLSGGILGYAQFPGGTAATDGVVILFSTLPGGTYSPYNLGRTATHEVGHWLNLRHIWGDASCGTDLVNDTPTQQASNYGCPSFPHSTCSNGANGDMFMNYMDYTNDACMKMFSSGQSTRMNALFVTGGSRAALLNSLGCSGTTAGCGTAGSVSASSITTSGATISWGAVSGATSYNIQYKTNAATTWSTVTSTSTSKALSGLTSATLHNVKVQAVCSSGAGTYSSVANFTTATPCVAPTGLNSSSISISGATISWTPASGAISYNLQYKLSTASTWTNYSTTSSSVALTGLLSGTLYNVQVQTVCSGGSSAFTPASSFTTLTPTVTCSAPSSVSAGSITVSGVTISWPAVSGALSYNVLYKLRTASTWSSYNTTSTSAAIASLLAATIYDVKLQTVCSGGTSSYSTTISFTTLALPTCATPTGLSASSITTSGATVSWAAVSGAVSYNLQYKANSSTTWTTVNTTSTSRALSGLAAGTLYNLKVQTICALGSSSYSSIVNFTTSAAVVCATPTDLKASSVTSSSAAISWLAVSGATNYNLQYKLSSSSSWITVSLAGTSHTLTGLASSATYNLQVRTVCSGGNSGYSSVVNFTTAAALTGCTDSYESNDSKTTAKTFPLNNSIAGNIGTSTDVDFFNFVVSSSSRNVKITLDNLPQNYNFKLFRGSTLVYTSNKTGTTIESLVLNNASTTSVFYVKVYGVNGGFDNTQCYNLNIATSSTAFSRWTKYDHEVDFIDENTIQEISIYPNPAHDRINIATPFEAMQDAKLTIYDMMGRRITESSVDIEEYEPVTMDVSNLESGMYLLSVEENGEVYTKKFFVGK